MKKFEWAVIGSGIAGIVTSEILSREGHSVILIEKNETLASETTREFHEWIHTGSLYTLIPDNLKTLKFLLGAIDDLLEFYSSYGNMNIIPSESGLKITNSPNGWFENNNIHFKFRINNRKSTFPWLFGIARAIFLIDQIKTHDWLRQRAGITDPFKLKFRTILSIFLNLFRHKEKFFDYETPDFTVNSRNLIKDMINQSIQNGLSISTGNEFLSFQKTGSKIIINCSKESYEVENLVLCIGGNLSKYTPSTVKVSYAPLAIVDNLNQNCNSFVELDYFPQNCINIIKKSNNIGLIGGISFSDVTKCEDYINEVIDKHKQYNPDLSVLYKYNGIKSEIVLKNQPRNYLYHILELEKNIWGIIPGKFTLGFSIAPEFYRRVYKKNPHKYFTPCKPNTNNTDVVSNTVWHDVAKSTIF